MKSIVLTLFIIPFLLINNGKENVSENNPVVLELFTSQGCSSCPTADRVLNHIKSDKVIALSYHVDYWNYIGWKDPFSKSAYSDKQRLYASKFNSSSIYTPQLVINGREHLVGSKGDLIKEKVSQYAKKVSQDNIVIENTSKSDAIVFFDYKFSGNLINKRIRAVLVINERTTSIKRGENRNRELVNANIVVNEQQFKLNATEGKGSITIPKIVETTDDLSLIIIIEDNKLNITTASQASL